MSNQRYQGSGDLVLKTDPEDELAEKKAERREKLRVDFIHSAMKTEVGQDFFHEMIFAHSVPGVGLVGINSANPALSPVVEGIRASQAALNEEVRRFADPSDYAEMIMRPLGGRRPESVSQQERKTS